MFDVDSGTYKFLQYTQNGEHEHDAELVSNSMDDYLSQKEKVCLFVMFLQYIIITS